MLDKKWKIYQRLEVVVVTDRLKFPAAFTPSSLDTFEEPARALSEDKISVLAEKEFLDNYSPTFAVIDEKYRLVYVRGRTGKYLEIASGQPSLSIMEMAREGLRAELASAIYRASSQQKTITREGLRVKYNGGFQLVNLTVAPLTAKGLPHGALIVVFQEAGLVPELPVKKSLRGSKRVVELEDELRLLRENHQAAVEELEATNEELKSANEELQSNNEELQSTNEELDTSREELQSLNEELSTVNSELQDKNEQLNKANDDLNNFLNRTDIAIILLDNELNIRSYTPATSEIFNVRKIDIGRPFAEITSRLMNKQVVGDASQVLRTMQPKELEVQRDDGHWYNMHISTYRTAQNAINGLVMSILDIDQQKKAAGSLRETSDYLNNLFNNAAVPIIVWDSGLKITRFNHAFEKITGRSADEMLGKKVDILIPVNKRSEALREINHATTMGERLEAVEIPVQHVDGSIRIVLWNSATVFDTDGKAPVATIAQGQDITERKKVEGELKTRTSELEIVNRELESYSYSISHDLRAPLRTLDGFSEAVLLDYGDKLDKQGKDYLNRIRTASQTMSQMIGDVLNMSRVTRSDIHHNELNLSNLVQKIVAEIKAAQPERQVEFVIQPDVVVYGDVQLLEIALRNLIDNSWKFTGKTPHPRIEFGSESQDGKQVYFVKDNGVGFDMKYADKLFQPFRCLHSEAEFPGTGIGLATVQRIIRRHGGRIWGESKKDKGTKFYFTLGGAV